MIQVNSITSLDELSKFIDTLNLIPLPGSEEIVIHGKATWFWKGQSLEKEVKVRIYHAGFNKGKIEFIYVGNLDVFTYPTVFTLMSQSYASSQNTLTIRGSTFHIGPYEVKLIENPINS